MSPNGDDILCWKFKLNSNKCNLTVCTLYYYYNQGYGLQQLFIIYIITDLLSSTLTYFYDIYLCIFITTE